jgi:hypothetical protein
MARRKDVIPGRLRLSFLLDDRFTLNGTVSFEALRIPFSVAVVLVALPKDNWS